MASWVGGGEGSQKVWAAQLTELLRVDKEAGLKGSKVPVQLGAEQLQAFTDSPPSSTWPQNSTLMQKNRQFFSKDTNVFSLRQSI
jgi:hypothetical protein